MAAVAPAKVADVDFRNYIDKQKIYAQKTATFKIVSKPTAEPVKHSGPQGKVEPLTIIDDPADWTSASLEGKEDSYIYNFNQEDVAELAEAVEALKARGISNEDDILALTAEDFKLPTLAAKIKALGKEVSQGRGFHIVRNFPVEHFKEDRVGLVLAFWALALHLGRPLVSQTDYKENGDVFGSVLNHVTDGRHANVHQKSVYQAGGESTSAAAPPNRGKEFDTFRLNFHSDQGATDLIALLSLETAKEGGVSNIVSSVAIHNELLRRGRKDLVEVLSQPGLWYTALKADQLAYKRKEDGSFEGYEEVIPFEYHNGYLTVHFEASKYQDIKLTPLQEEAVWAVASLAEDPKFHLARKLEKGELLIIHNPSVFHARTAIVDGETIDDKRHLLRWWVHTHDNPRPVAPHFAPRSNVHPDGGFSIPKGSKIRLPLYPYSRHDGLGQSPASPNTE